MTSHASSLQSRAVRLIPRLQAETGIDFEPVFRNLASRASAISSLSRVEKNYLASEVSAQYSAIGREAPRGLEDYLSRYGTRSSSGEPREEVIRMVNDVKAQSEAFGKITDEGLKNEMLSLVGDACDQFFGMDVNSSNAHTRPSGHFRHGSLDKSSQDWNSNSSYSSSGSSDSGSDGSGSYYSRNRQRGHTPSWSSANSSASGVYSGPYSPTSSCASFGGSMSRSSGGAISVY
ncbi:hypothetical protein CI109_102828 [Kwoniella shandongensis]|uniref:Uncharacterized protein n=1 Tax=Kwoniella shandongensis TaxID=1734106 RepID=A0A5M6C8F2_9TREE|nr:uncharacterized protein CI109_000019 [Kwoniella shandongensis]KAA5531181.1 hypothetical protein CI109_000019 [Kwoniella shandongensis]